ncbi:MAG: amylo-alpha-1,6-glucosidase [Lentisphaeria bacterium]
MNISQTPATFSKTVLYSGDFLDITLEIDRIIPGKAFVRTNLGNNTSRLREIIEQVELGKPCRGQDWHDIAMEQMEPKRFKVTLPINEVGYFEFKAFFVDSNSKETFWPRGENASVKIEPAMTFSGNTIYNAFVRQFGPNKAATADSPQHLDAEKLLNAENYTVLPPSGTFRDLTMELDFIIGELGFRIIQLLPIHPTPTTFGRMGRFGSPFAPLDFFTVDSALATFDRKATPLEQFIELIDEIHVRDALVMLDVPIGHSGWGSVFQVHHPEWFVRNADGTFVSPGAWGVVWEDLCKMDYHNQELWQQMAIVFLHWCRLGVDGFRCDAGYMIPAEAWNYLIAKVRDEYPETIFFLEGLGGKIETTERLLSKSNLNWAYSEMFQQYTADDIRRYLDFTCRFAQQSGALVHFAETHDNSRLAARSKAWATLRTTLAALLAPAGCFGIANGVEWLCTEKINVHEASPLNWSSPDNLVALIKRLNTILLTHPAFQAGTILQRPASGNGSAIALLRIPTDRKQTLLIIINPEEQQTAFFEWSAEDFAPTGSAWDLLNEKNLNLTPNSGRFRMELPPAGCCCLAKSKIEPASTIAPTANQWQTMKDIVLDTFTFHKGFADATKLKMNHLLEKLHRNPIEFLRELYGPKVYLPVLFWQPHRDETRIVPLPPEHHLLIRNKTPFVVKISLQNRCLQKHRSIPLEDGSHFALFQPLPVNGQTQMAELEINLFANQKASRHKGIIALLPKHPVPLELRLRAEELTPAHCALATSELGAYAMPRAIWGTIQSQYDAMLAANLDPAVPVDRTIMLTRCRAWLVHRDYSRELNLSCQEDFSVLDSQSMCWNFTVPSGLGENIKLRVTLQLSRNGNAVYLSFTRNKPADATEQEHLLSPAEPICLILRPDIDERSCHNNTKAFHGAETKFPNATRKLPHGFEFSPSGKHTLRMSCSQSCYFTSPEWKYQVPHPFEQERGLEPTADLFSPGFFRSELNGGETICFEAMVTPAGQATTKTAPPPAPPEHSSARKVLDILRESLQNYLVKRENSYTIIAGYPWFLDWGRDTLIALRGMIAAGMLQESSCILRQFASFEQGGTLPNTLQGHQIANRDTSDAPLWLFVAVRDFLEAANNPDLLQADCQGRTLLQVLESIVENYRQGTANGISVCPETALVFSPSHFTWMDTNYPAATPREGYPVEIQALWIAALELLGKVTGKKNWKSLAETARKNLQELFYTDETVGFSDCLHAAPGTSARLAVADDLCRPNQLLAVTLGALDSHKIQRHILRATQPLLVPGGIRSLADQQVHVAQAIYHHGNLLNDPLAPYWGTYLGDEDTRRKPAYHNGTAWGWLLPSYCEALYLTFGKSARPAVHALHNLAAGTLLRGCLGHLPEILDGNAPHQIRGCSAQAWSVSELFRVLNLLQKEVHQTHEKN